MTASQWFDGVVDQVEVVVTRTSRRPFAAKVSAPLACVAELYWVLMPSIVTLKPVVALLWKTVKVAVPALLASVHAMDSPTTEPARSITTGI